MTENDDSPHIFNNNNGKAQSANVIELTSFGQHDRTDILIIWPKATTAKAKDQNRIQIITPERVCRTAAIVGFE